MLFKLSLKNIKKSFRDYAIYFITLILGVAIFYIFNSLDSQQAMVVMGSSTKEIIELMIQLLSGMSVFVSFILGFLIVYANNFLIKRRKKEFGVYMTLGMGKNQISRILLGETLVIGLLSLAAGLVIGVFGAQFMSLLVVKLFNGMLDEYGFVFSKAAFFKTILYFGIMFAIVAVFNVISLSRCQLIQLLSAGRKNEKVKMKNTTLCALVFFIAAADLGVQYYLVSNPEKLDVSWVPFIIAAGCIGTFFVFWSLSGFLLKLMQSRKSYYLKELNAFVLRQIHSKINTAVFSMTVICLMLFLTISVLCSGLGINYSLQNMLNEMTPMDVNIQKKLSGSEEGDLMTMLENRGFDTGLLAGDYVEIPLYATEELTEKDTMKGRSLEAMGGNYVWRDLPEVIMKVSDYNKLAAAYGNPPIEVPEGAYGIICDYEPMKELRDVLLEDGETIVLDGKEFKPAYEGCQYGFVSMAANHSESGVFILPDESVKEEWKTYLFMAADYTQGADKEKTEEILMNSDISIEEGFSVNTKIDIQTASVGLSVIATFIAIYLGMVFLLSGAAILALKELSESSDNRERYNILRKIGADEKMINKALFRQIGIFFFLPLILAVVHSVFGMMFIKKILESLGNLQNFASILTTAGIFLVVYGGYFLITYLGSRRIIRSR